MNKNSLHFFCTSATPQWWSVLVMIYKTMTHPCMKVKLSIFFSDIFWELIVSNQTSGLCSLELWQKATCFFMIADFASNGQTQKLRKKWAGYLQVLTIAGQKTNFLFLKKDFQSCKRICTGLTDEDTACGIMPENIQGNSFSSVANTWQSCRLCIRISISSNEGSFFLCSWLSALYLKKIPWFLLWHLICSLAKIFKCSDIY